MSKETLVDLSTNHETPKIRKMLAGGGWGFLSAFAGGRSGEVSGLNDETIKKIKEAVEKKKRGETATDSRVEKIAALSNAAVEGVNKTARRNGRLAMIARGDDPYAGMGNNARKIMMKADGVTQDPRTTEAYKKKHGIQSTPAKSSSTSSQPRVRVASTQTSTTPTRYSNSGYDPSVYGVNNRDDVIRMLNELIANGYNIGSKTGKADGVWGRATQAAYEAYQHKLATNSPTTPSIVAEQPDFGYSTNFDYTGSNEAIRNLGFNDYNSLKEFVRKNPNHPFARDLVKRFNDVDKWYQKDIESSLGIRGKYRRGKWGDYSDIMNSMAEWAGTMNGTHSANVAKYSNEAPNGYAMDNLGNLYYRGQLQLIKPTLKQSVLSTTPTIQLFLNKPTNYSWALFGVKQPGTMTVGDYMKYRFSNATDLNEKFLKDTLDSMNNFNKSLLKYTAFNPSNTSNNTQSNKDTTSEKYLSLNWAGNDDKGITPLNEVAVIAKPNMERYKLNLPSVTDAVKLQVVPKFNILKKGGILKGQQGLITRNSKYGRSPRLTEITVTKNPYTGSLEVSSEYVSPSGEYWEYTSRKDSQIPNTYLQQTNYYQQKPQMKRGTTNFPDTVAMTQYHTSGLKKTVTNQTTDINSKLYNDFNHMLNRFNKSMKNGGLISKNPVRRFQKKG